MAILQCKADAGNLHARGRTSEMSQKATNRIAAIEGLFDHLISGDHFG
jgi:hypothetical protein